MRLALFQNDPRPLKPEENLAPILETLPLLARQGVELLVLPEMFLRSPGGKGDLDDPTLWERLLSRIQEGCRQHRIAMAFGFPRFSGGQVFNSLFFLHSTGEVLGVYDKIHLFSPMEEKERYAPGQEPKVVEYSGFRFGLSICYDLRFPELYRAERELGAEVFLIVAQWPSERSDHFSLLLRARAVENLAYSVGVNRTGSCKGDGQAYSFLGGSAAYHPWGDPLWVCGKEPGFGVVELRREVVEEVRKRFPVWEDRREELFSKAR